MESRRLERVESVRAVIDFIEEHLDSSLSLDQTAAAVHYSKYHLHRIFSSMTGMTIHDYAVRRRLTEGPRGYFTLCSFPLRCRSRAALKSFHLQSFQMGA